MIHPRVTLLTVLAVWSTATHAATCEALATLTAPKAVIGEARAIGAGSFRAPDTASALAQLPAFCPTALTTFATCWPRTS